MHFWKICVICIPASFVVQPAFARLPDPVRAMIEAAFEDGNTAAIATVIALAKRTNPDDTAEIDAMQAAYDAEQAETREDQLRARSAFDGWSGEGEVGFSQSTGNSDNLNLSAGIALSREGLRWRHDFRARADSQRSNGATTREQFLVALQPQYKFGEHLFTFGLLQYERDRFQNYSARYTASGGLGYRAVDEDDLTLDLSFGPAWRRTEFIGGGADSSITGFASLDLQWDITDGFALRERASALLESETTTFTSETSLEARLIGALSGRLTYLVEYESDPPDGRKKTDTLTRATIVYDF
ncbi:MAG: DUF481 domain-containing protein [Pseudomonadota bacterium]